MGGSTYGEGDRYAQKAGSDLVYLIRGSLVNDLSAAQSRLMQRELHGFELDKVETVKVQALGKSKTLLQRNRASQAAVWVDAANPEQRNKLYGNWLSQVSRMRASAYLEIGKEPGSDLAGPAGELEPVASITYEAEGRRLGAMELVRVVAGDKSYYYVKSELTRGWVTVLPSSAEQVARDLGLVVGAQDTPPSKKPAAGPPQPAAK